MPQTPRSNEYWGLRNSAASTIALSATPVILTSGAAAGALAAMAGGSDTLTTSESASAFSAAAGEYTLRTTGRSIVGMLFLKANKSAAGESVTIRLVAGAAGDAAGVGAVLWQYTILSVADAATIHRVTVPIMTQIPPSQGGVLTLQAVASGATNLVIAAADDLVFRAEVMQHRVGYAV